MYAIVYYSSHELIMDNNDATAEKVIMCCVCMCALCVICIVATQHSTAKRIHIFIAYITSRTYALVPRCLVI